MTLAVRARSVAWRVARRVLAALCGGTLAIANTVHAQSVTSPATLAGRVTTRAGAPVRDAIAAIEGSALSTRTDSAGRWSLTNPPSGPQMLVVRRVGFAPARIPIVVPPVGQRTIDVVLTVSALQLEQLIVTADRIGRARGELGTASVVDRDAIANQTASSLQGVLELIPGVPLTAPGLDAATPFALRTLAQTSTAQGIAGGPTASDIGAAGTLIVLDGVPLSNNANLQTVGARGEVVSPASTAGSGIDLRRIPAATLERVEVIRGIPSARWGDLTQGAIVVDTRAAAAWPELALRSDPRTTEGNAVGGGAFANERLALTVTANLTETRATRTLSNATTQRSAGQLAHRWQVGGSAAPFSTTRGPLTFDTRADWWQLRYNAPERADIEPGRTSYTNDQGIRLSERARLTRPTYRVELTAAYDAQTQRTRESRRLGRPASPFTDRLTEGRSIGRYVEGLYDGAYSLDGAPRLLYTRLEYEHGNDAAAPSSRDAVLRANTWRIGTELRREWNSGSGYAFAIDRPPQSSTYNGVTGFDRPRRFDGAPPLTTSALYVDWKASLRVLGVAVDVQPGLRADAMHDGAWWTSGTRSAMLEPRFNMQLSPTPWLRLRGGAGAVSKVPTIAQRSPTLQYFDVVNVNRFTPDPRERLAVLTTFIRDPTNRELGLSRGAKRELGLELDGGAARGAMSLTWFDDRVTGAVTLRRDPGVVTRDRFALADTARGSGQPGRIVEPAIGSDPIPVFLDRYVNSGRLGSRGVELTMTLPVIAALRTRVEVSGARVETSFATDDRDFGNFLTVANFQLDSTVKRLAYYDGVAQRARRGVLTWRVVHHQPSVGLVVTATVQQQLGDERIIEHRTDSLAFAGYLTRTGQLVPVPEADRTRAEYADLRRGRAATSANVFRQPNDWLMSLQVAKSVAGSGRLSFYVFNALDKLAVFGGGSVRAVPSMRFGAELTLPTAGWGR
jgi:hypothetical protein